MNKINQRNNFQNSNNKIGQDYSNSNIETQYNSYYFKINKNYIIAFLTILFLVSLFFNYEFYNKNNKLADENTTLKYQIKVLPILLKKEKNTNQVFDEQKAKKEIDELIK